jgi:hypothetical protein
MIQSAYPRNVFAHSMMSAKNIAVHDRYVINYYHVSIDIIPVFFDAEWNDSCGHGVACQHRLTTTHIATTMMTHLRIQIEHVDVVDA